MNEPTETDGSDGTAEFAAASETAESERKSGPESNSERECPACGDSFEDGAAYRDHLFSVGLVY
ncbi:hypothetical protein C474_05610 [Halogeometricum pallidum JCM 14848]|uniref:C2H2-type domain-containing protein n=1 Tax=Halogeometricum pallidum JCM 14848 TaxID=1227487 RepID=M0DFQ1_HALPD|nr:hypothetical protein [Halogeometricum pallidum]ELZ33532.1 hypothetical protein C474_05610 [Halogeometricum pallidum JCM 14848]